MRTHTHTYICIYIERERDKPMLRNNRTEFFEGQIFQPIKYITRAVVFMDDWAYIHIYEI